MTCRVTWPMAWLAAVLPGPPGGILAGSSSDEALPAALPGHHLVQRCALGKGGGGDLVWERAVEAW